jgi:hypothetical protein
MISDKVLEIYNIKMREIDTNFILDSTNLFYNRHNFIMKKNLMKNIVM